MDENESGDNEEICDEEESNDNKNKTLHVKLAYNLARINSNYEMETDTSIGSNTNKNKEHEFRDGEMITFDSTTDKRL